MGLVAQGVKNIVIYGDYGWARYEHKEGNEFVLADENNASSYEHCDDQQFYNMEKDEFPPEGLMIMPDATLAKIIGIITALYSTSKRGRQMFQPVLGFVLPPEY